MSSQTNSGFSLVELLLSLTLLTIALLAIDVTETAALQAAGSTYLLHVGENQMQSIIQRLHTQGESVRLNEITEKWNEENREVLPKGQGIVTGQYPDYTITLFWGGGQTCTENKIGMTGCLKIEIR